jgi:hypothetical protein
MQGGKREILGRLNPLNGTNPLNLRYLTGTVTRSGRAALAQVFGATTRRLCVLITALIPMGVGLVGSVGLFHAAAENIVPHPISSSVSNLSIRP